MSEAEPRFLVGTSGWSYPAWRGVFYPENLPQTRWFPFYAERFRTVEVNATFYRGFRDQTYHKWRERAPEGFVYVIKAHRLITHRKYLKDVGEQIAAVWRSASLLRNRLGLVLLQLAPRTPYEPGRLREALLTFGDPRRVAVEFRDAKWFTDETRELLQDVGAVFCSADSPKTELLDWVTSDAAYIRLHGRARWYDYDYSALELEQISGMARRMARAGAKDVYVFFNNDMNGYAPKNASVVLEELGA